MPHLIPNGSRVTWQSHPDHYRDGHRDTFSGVVVAFGYVDMPWRLYTVLADHDQHYHHIHPDLVMEVR